jgi:hypothetical protein
MKNRIADSGFDGVEYNLILDSLCDKVNQNDVELESGKLDNHDRDELRAENKVLRRLIEEFM